MALGPILIFKNCAAVVPDFDISCPKVIYVIIKNVNVNNFIIDLIFYSYPEYETLKLSFIYLFN